MNVHNAYSSRKKFYTVATDQKGMYIYIGMYVCVCTQTYILLLLSHLSCGADVRSLQNTSNLTVT
jgi:hypothetical protein